MNTQGKPTLADYQAGHDVGQVVPAMTVNERPATREAWFYEAASRTLFDENRLPVARDIGHDDARTILLAIGCDPDFAIVGEAMPNPLFAVLADMLAYEAEKFDRAPLEFEVYDSVLKRSLGPFESREVAQAEVDRLAFCAEIVEIHGELNVSGSDLVDAFTNWRDQLNAALDYARPPTLAAVAREAAELLHGYADHHMAQAGIAAGSGVASFASTVDDRLAKAERNRNMAAKLDAALGKA